ncbi:MAG: pyruvate kinase alpha/beta domain-containing protein [Halodesulfurarchaeum sp.]|nr:pyruvate kinase alpha/beta domain-containing protein [Halodesulfurarchaeum sp.]
MFPTDDMGTEAVLKRASEYAVEHEIPDVVVASTSGETGAMAARLFDTSERNVVVVGHSTGYREPNEQEFQTENRELIEQAGGSVFVGPMVFSNVGSALREKDGFSAHEVVADVLRLFGQGTKVALEIVLMGCDAGLVPADEEVLAIGGTGSGADTVVTVQSANSRDLFAARIRDVVGKPTDSENLFYW